MSCDFGRPSTMRGGWIDSAGFWWFINPSVPLFDVFEIRLTQPTLTTSFLTKDTHENKSDDHEFTSENGRNDRSEKTGDVSIGD